MCYLIRWIFEEFRVFLKYFAGEHVNLSTLLWRITYSVVYFVYPVEKWTLTKTTFAWPEEIRGKFYVWRSFGLKSVRQKQKITDLQCRHYLFHHYFVGVIFFLNRLFLYADVNFFKFRNCVFSITLKKRWVCLYLHKT